MTVDCDKFLWFSKIEKKKKEKKQKIYILSVNAKGEMSFANDLYQFFKANTDTR